MSKKINLPALIAIALLVLIQFIPYGRQHNNPAVVQEPLWDSQQTRGFVQRECFDCHSNETTWPWYSNIAPISWLVQSNVEEGRLWLNFSEYGQKQVEASEIIEVVQAEVMPPGEYLILHPAANLSTGERDTFLAGLQATFTGK